ncbi:hypothetical protein ACNKHM_11255 [Shigella sonnei]
MERCQQSLFGRPTHPGVTRGHWIRPQGTRFRWLLCRQPRTASAVIASPLNGSRRDLSSGTWSLMGFKARRHFTNQHGAAANITNEGGAEGRYRGCRKYYGLTAASASASGSRTDDLPALIAATQALPACRLTTI